MDEKVLKALGNTQRLHMILCLQVPHTVSQLQDKCTLSQSALSQHLTKLKSSGIVHCTRDGVHQVYQVRDKKFLQAARALLQVIS